MSAQVPSVTVVDMEHLHQWGQIHPGPWGTGAPPFIVPFIGGTMLIFLLLLVMAGFFLARKGRLGRTAVGARPSQPTRIRGTQDPVRTFRQQRDRQR